MSTRNRRQQRIVDLIGRRSVPNQQRLQALLAGEGIDVAQATLSRDLRQLGLVKGPSGYMLPGSSNGTAREGTPAGRNGTGRGGRTGTGGGALGPLLTEAIRSWVDSVRQADSVVVLRTGPGRAQPVAVELDRTPPAGAVGTIAGDDTVFIAAASVRDAKRLTEALRAAGSAAVQEAHS